MSADATDRPAAPPGPARGAVLFFKNFWLVANVAVVLFCLIVVYVLFGLATFVSFLLGIGLVAGVVILYVLGKRLARALLEAIRGSG